MQVIPRWVHLDSANTERNICVLVLLSDDSGGETQTSPHCFDFGTVCSEFSAKKNEEAGKPQNQP